jgi:hypothetical protein
MNQSIQPMPLLWGEKNSAIIKADLTTAEKMVLTVLFSYADNKTDTCYPSVPTIAHWSGLSDRTVQRCLNKMVKRKIVKKDARFIKNAQVSNLYWIDFVNLPLLGNRPKKRDGAVFAGKGGDKNSLGGGDSSKKRDGAGFSDYGGDINSLGGGDIDDIIGGDISVTGGGDKNSLGGGDTSVIGGGDTMAGRTDPTKNYSILSELHSKEELLTSIFTQNPSIDLTPECCDNLQNLEVRNPEESNLEIENPEQGCKDGLYSYEVIETLPVNLVQFPKSANLIPLVATMVTEEVKIEELVQPIASREEVKIEELSQPIASEQEVAEVDSPALIQEKYNRLVEKYRLETEAYEPLTHW